MKFDSKYNLGQTIFLRHGDEKGIVTGVTFIPGSCLYTITWADGSSGDHFVIELTDDPNDRFETK